MKRKPRLLLDYPVESGEDYRGVSFPPVFWSALKASNRLDVFSSLQREEVKFDVVLVINGGSHRTIRDMSFKTFSPYPFLEHFLTKYEAQALQVGRVFGLGKIRYYDRLCFPNTEYEKRVALYKRANPSVKIVHRLDGNYWNICKRYGYDRSVRRINDIADLTIHQSRYSESVWNNGVETLFGQTQTLQSKKTLLIWNGVDTSIFRSDGANKEFKGAIKVLHVAASASPNKGLSTVLELARILRENAKVQFYLVGNQDQDPLCGSNIGDFDNVHHLGMIKDRHELATIMRSMTMFLYPSINDCSANVILEAMASGLPVAAASSGGNEELIMKADACAGQLINPQNPVMALRTILDNLQSFREGAIKIIEKYHRQDLMTARYERAILDALNLH